MAKEILLKNPYNQLLEKGYYGFSWTYLFFGWLVPVCRGEFGIAIFHFIITVLSGGLWQILGAFFYNKQYTKRLLARGYTFCDAPEREKEAKKSLGVYDAPTCIY